MLRSGCLPMVTKTIMFKLFFIFIYNPNTPSRSNTQRCADNEKCFTEIHPLYIKRGCTIPDTLNRTIVCRCHQCNAKHSNDLNNFEYSSIADWESDSKRLSEPSVGINLLCKFCVTRGVNHDSDEKCKEGRK